MIRAARCLAGLAFILAAETAAGAPTIHTGSEICIVIGEQFSCTKERF